MGLPFIQEVWDGLRWLIDFFFSKSPRIVKLLFFLLFLLLFGNMISWFLEFGGVHCNSELEPVKVSSLDIITNSRLFWYKTDGSFIGDNLSFEEVHPYSNEADTPILDCIFYLKDNGGGDFVDCLGTNETGCEFYYRKPDCYNCSTVDAGWVDLSEQSNFGLFYVGDICQGEVRKGTDYFRPQEVLLCDSTCSIPNNYHWDTEEGMFFCDDLDICGDNATPKANPKLDEILNNADAELIYTTKSKKDFNNVLLIKCTKNYNPRLTVFGIDIFSYKIWIMLFVISGMFLFLRNIRAH